MLRDLPDFLIVGTMKSGTTTLAYYLNQQKDIFMPSNEVHFFDGHGPYSEKWSRGMHWYKEQFKYAKKQQAVGEKSPTYSYFPDVPARVKNTIPNVKLIWIFRHPVERTYSNYWHNVLKGREYMSFKSAIKHEKKRVKKNILKGYVKRSMYIEQIERYLGFFDKEQMYFTTLNSLRSDLLGTIEEICDFIEVDYKNSILEKKPKQKNKGYVPRSIKLYYITYQLLDNTSIFYRTLKRVNKSYKKPDMDNHLRNRLLKRFKCPNQELRELTGLELSHWRK